MNEQQTVVISNRLKCLTEMVTLGNTVADVGCDHGFVSIYLVQNKISPKVIAMDVRTGPLSKAQEHIALYDLNDYIETRLSDGLTAFSAGEAQTMICAGMGGKLMQKILSAYVEKSKSFKELILQPQSELQEFRYFLRHEGYKIVEENILCEDGKYYFPMKVIPVGDMQETELTDNELFDKYGELLLKQKEEGLREYLLYKQNTLSLIEDELSKQKKERAQSRLTEIREELQEIAMVLEKYFA